MLPAWIKSITMPKQDGYALHINPEGLAKAFRCDHGVMYSVFPKNESEQWTGMEYRHASGVQLTDDELVGMAIQQMANAELWHGNVIKATGSWFTSNDIDFQIKRTLNEARMRAIKMSVGCVRQEDMHLLLNTLTACRMFYESPEIKLYLKSMLACSPSMNLDFGPAHYLPRMLYGVKVHEDERIPLGKAFIVSVLGADRYGTPDLSTVHEYHFNGHRATLLTCPASGCMITDIDGEDADSDSPYIVSKEASRCPHSGTT